MSGGRGVKPSLIDIIFVIWAVVVPIGFGFRLLNSDGDVARHLRLGEMMIDRGALVRTDSFSHTMAGRPFIAFEWGSEVVYAAAYKAAGLAGVCVLAGLVLALTYALVARFLIRRGGDPLLAYFVSMAAAVLSAAHWLARPHLFTMLGVVLLLELLQRTHRRELWLYFPFFVVWANLHGGFFYGCTLLGLFVAAELAEARLASPGSPHRAEWLGRARHHALALLIALAASLVNPNGITLLAHVAGFFGNSAIIAGTQEFMSPDFHTINGKIFLVVLLAVVASLSWSSRRPPLTTLLVLLANVAFALLSQRNIELFALVSLPLVALHLDPHWRRMRLLSRAKEVFQREHAGSHPWAGAAVVSLLLIALARSGGSVAGYPLVPNRFDGKAFPAGAVDRARRASLEGRMFNNFIWGGYLMYAWPEQRVFIDGGTDHYGEKLFQEYVQVVSLEPGWRAILDRRRVTFALMPPDSRLAYELAGHLNWGVWYCDSVAAILKKPTGQTSAGDADTAALARCGSTGKAGSGGRDRRKG